MPDPNPILEPDREPISLDRLPPPDTSRWVARRKAQVVAAVEAGLLTADEACRRYKLTVEELISWQRALYRFGLRGLQATRVQICRMAEEREQKQREWTRKKRPPLAGHHA
ncbi:MAG TPA: DUF1153 domain-containing protein [Allosphingosinicella sp.]|jgi:hypothetical protein